MATAASASASPAALRAKTPAPGAHPSPKPSLAFPWPSPGASASASAAASGRLHASLHLGGVRGVGTANGAGLHVLHPDVKPLVVPKMAGGAGAQKSILLYHCEEMRDLAQQVAARNDDIELCTISWSDQSDDPNDHSSLLRVGLLALMIANLILTVANSCIPSRRRR